MEQNFFVQQLKAQSNTARPGSRGVLRAPQCAIVTGIFVSFCTVPEVAVCEDESGPVKSSVGELVHKKSMGKPSEDSSRFFFNAGLNALCI